MPSPIEHRVGRFSELHANKWFHVMNWNLDFMLITDKAQRAGHRIWALDFYMAAANPPSLIISGPGYYKSKKLITNPFT